MRKSVALTSSLLITLGLLSGAFIFRQQIRDFAVVQTSSLSPEASTLLTSLELTDSAEFIYKASRPEVQPAQQFNQSCSSVAREHSIVLGCYTEQRFFIYDVKDQRLGGVKEVTAAHELLHAVYERLDKEEKDELNTILITTANSINDERFKSTIDEYRQSEPDQLANEYHSILATEIEVLPSNLEAHYKKYFHNRKKIVGYAKQYESAFTSLEDQIKDYDLQLTDLRKQKEALERSLSRQQTEIEAEQARLDSLRARGDATAYNQAVPDFNARVQSYNADVSRLKQIVSDYNVLVEKRNTLATTQNNLVQQLDSSYQRLE